MQVCKECLSKWKPYHDSGSIMCSKCEQSSSSIEIKTTEYILGEFKKRSEALYYSLPKDGEDFYPNGKTCEDPLSYFSDKVITILDEILSDIIIGK